MKFKIVSFLTILYIIFFAGCDSKDSTKIANNEEHKTTLQEPKKEEIVKRTTFNLKTTDDKIIETKITEDSVKMTGFEDKVIMVTFFATWCPPCKAEIPHFNSLKKRFKDKLEIISLLLESDKNNQEIRDFMEKNKISYLVTNSSENFELAQAIGNVKAIPTIFLYAKSGKLIEKYVGVVPEEMLESDIKKGLEK